MKLYLFIPIIISLAGGFFNPLLAMEQQSDRAVIKKSLKGQFEHVKASLERAIVDNQKTVKITESASAYPSNGSMDKLFKASEDLLLINDPVSLENHPLYESFTAHKPFKITLKSGPSIQNITDILLEKHGLLLSKPESRPAVKIFNNAETFMRFFDIFKKKYEEKSGHPLKIDLAYTLMHTPLDEFCADYIKQYPELIGMSPGQREKFIRLLTVFMVGDDIVEMVITLSASVDAKVNNAHIRSFKPIALNLDSQQIGSNDISLGQKNLDKQIQNLSGSELAMPYIKDADGAAQFKALGSVIGRKEISVVDLGGGRGETNALIKAIKDSGSTVQLLNIEPYQPFAKPYIDAHKAIGVEDVQVWQQSAQECSAAEIIKHFNNKKVDVLFASHSLYFILGDMHKIAAEYANGNTFSLEKHPLWKYFQMLDDKGVFVITLQTGAGARLYRNALLGKHGLDQVVSETEDETVPLLSSFGNMATFLRHFELFAKHYQQTTGKKINVKMHYALANVPLGDFEIKPDTATGGYTMDIPAGSVSSKMLDFYGNWTELQSLMALTPEKVNALSTEEQKKLGLENAPEAIAAKQQAAAQSQAIFSHILRAFAPAQKNMQHPNIVLEITIN